MVTDFTSDLIPLQVSCASCKVSHVVLNEKVVYQKVESSYLPSLVLNLWNPRMSIGPFAFKIRYINL